MKRFDAGTALHLMLLIIWLVLGVIVLVTKVKLTSYVFFCVWVCLIISLIDYLFDHNNPSGFA